jgi:hypothetical protein
MAVSDPRKALRWLDSLSGNGPRASARGAVYSAWAETDPLAAFAAMQADGAPAVQASSAKVGEMLSVLPLEEAMPAATASPDDPAIRQWIFTWNAREPAALIRGLFQLPDSASRQELIRIASENWRRSGSEKAQAAMREALESEPAGELRNRVSLAYIESIARTGNADAAFEWLEKELPAAEQRKAFEKLAGGLASSDPEAMASRLGRLPADLRAITRAQLLQVWLQTEPAKAKAWEAAHPKE